MKEFVGNEKIGQHIAIIKCDAVKTITEETCQGNCNGNYLRYPDAPNLTYYFTNTLLKNHFTRRKYVFGKELRYLRDLRKEIEAITFQLLSKP